MTEAVYDAILLNGLPGDTDLLVAGSEMLQVDEPLDFSTQTAGQLSLGDTVTIGGTVYSITGLHDYEADMVNDDGGTTETVDGHIVELDDGAGGTFTYMLIGDGYANKTDITEAQLIFVDPTASVPINEHDGDDVVTLSAPTICYALGTLIDTPDGPRPVEFLVPGDLVSTLDHGPQIIRWTRSDDHPLEDAKDDAKPVQIKAGALGQNLPTCDLIVSPQHRILVGGAGQLQSVFATELFAPAKSLTAVPGIRQMKGKTQVTWVHFACDRHEVVTANGCLSESLLLGPMVINGLKATERRALTDIFGPAPTPDAALNGPLARKCLKVGAVKRHIAKHLKETGQLVAKETHKWDRDLAMEKYETERMHNAQSLVQSSETASCVT